MELGGGIKTLEQKDFSVSESWTLWTPGEGTRSRIVETEESAIPPAGVQSAAQFYQESECYRHSQSESGDADADTHVGLSKKLLEGWTQIPVCNASSDGNAALPSDSVSSSSPFDMAAGGGQKEINLQCQSTQNEYPLPNSQKYNIHHSSPLIEKVVVPVTPDKCKRSGGEKIEEGNWFNKNDPGSDGKGSVQMICFSHYDSKPANVPYVGFPLQSESQQQEKTINLCVDLNSNKFCQLGPVTPEKFKRAQSYQLAEVNVAVGRETGECREKKNDAGSNCKVPVEICLNECTSKQADLPSLKFPQQHDLLQEMRDGEGTQLNKTPPEKARRKRHRPKVIIEGKPARKRKQTIPKLVDNPDDPPRKKRSVRKKETSSMESPSTGVGVTTEPQKSVRKSAKKTLNFDLEEIHVDDGIQASTWASKYGTDSWSKTSDNGSLGAQSTLGIRTEMVDSLAKTSFNLEHSVKQLPENQVPFSQHSRRQILRENLKDLARKRDTKKIQCSHDSTMPSGVQAIYPPTPQIWKNQGSERDCSHKDEDLFHVDFVLGKWGPRKSCNEMNRASEYDYSIYNQIRYVPEICKKRRTDNRQNKFAAAPMTSSFPKGGEQINDTHEEISSFVDAQRHLEKMHAVDHMSNIDQMERNMSQPSKSTILKFKLSSQATGTDCSQLPLILYNPMQGAERWVASIATPLKVPRKRRTKKESKSTSVHRTLKPSFSSRIMTSHVDPIDFITQRLQQLNINRSSDGVTLQGLHNDNALVLYTGGGAVVPFEGFFTPRKQLPRAKVDLDSETNRVWMLLMGKDNGNCPEGTDIDKEKWWEEERKVFQGRADSFIARMHLVQGDRRFSKWKGSVVDSVVGVFLTQNVSDHLSSSAFMSLAARFPKCSGSERISSAVNHDISTESEVISVLECSDNVRKQENQLKRQQTSQSLTMYNEAQNVEESRTCMFGYSEDSASPESRIELESVVSSQNSVVSSQHSSESVVQMVDQIGLSSESNSEIEGLEAGNCLNRSHFPTSFTELLQMTGRIASKEISGSEISLNKCDVFRHTNLVSDHLNKLGGDISMDRSNINHCPEQHDPVEGACAATAADLSSACDTGCAMMDNVEIVRESHSFLSSSTSGVTSTSDAVKACIIDGPLKKNTAEFHIEEKSVYTDSCTFIRNHPFQPCPCSREDAYSRSHSCNCNYIPSEKTELSPIKEPSILLDEHTDNLNQNGKETNFYAEGIHVETDSFTPKRNCRVQDSHLDPHNHPSTSGLTELSSSTEKQECISYKATESIIEDKKVNSEIAKEVIKPKRTEKKQGDTFDWDSLRKEACSNGVKRERSVDTMDSIDWEALRRADVSDISQTIRERGMNNMLAARIKDFLDRLVRDHGSIDLEWLRDVPPDKVKDYLLSIRGLGLKSVECVRLLTLEHLAFPVDTNVGRICVRLGWVPLQPLPESLQLHLLELYPMLETIQKYLWPRLCTLDQRTLYELHYQMITFGKVFCTKSKPNCNACPMRGECKHFASAFASARLALPGPEDKSLVSSTVPLTGAQFPKPVTRQAPLLQLEGNSASQEQIVNNYEPIIEEPATPEPDPEPVEVPENAIEDAFYEDPDEIPMIKLNIEQFTQNLQTILQENNELQDGGMSKALVALSPEAASIPQPKLKNINRLRTEHQVYELPDGHPLLDGLEQREPDDPSPYLLAIWTPGETARSMESPKTSCSSHLLGKLCESMTCFSCNSIREEEAHIVRGTLLIPCRTAMRGSFPLNGTYFQVNEVFADHHSSLSPLDIPRELIWNLPRRTVYFGTSVPTIFRGLTTEGIQHCFWKGFVCVRGFDQKTRAPRPLLARLHFPASKAPKNNKKTTTKEATRLQTITNHSTAGDVN